jgi:hypothetical protein
VVEKDAAAPVVDVAPKPEPAVAAPVPLVPMEPVPVGQLDLEDVRERFFSRVVPRTSRSAQLLLKAAQVRALDGQRLTIALASEEMRQNTEMIAQGLKGAMDHEFKSTLLIEWTVDPALLTLTPAPTQRSARRAAPVESTGDEEYSPDESSIVVRSAADHLITEMFPGAEEIS